MSPLPSVRAEQAPRSFANHFEKLLALVFPGFDRAPRERYLAAAVLMMMTMNTAQELRGSRRAGQAAARALRFGVALGLVFSIVHTLIHLYLEPHCEDTHLAGGPLPGHHGDRSVGETLPGDQHHECHSVAQHEFQITPPTRDMMVELNPAPTVEWVNPDAGGPPPDLVACSGLSPPELLHTWPFSFRTALPIRAPSLLA